MCYFLTVAVPAKHVDFLERLFQPEFQTLALTNPHAATAFPLDYIPRVITSGICSCDLFASPDRTQTDDFTAQLRLKYQREGWSEAKIQRAIEQAETSRARSPRLERGLRSDVVDRLRKLTETAGAAGVFSHWYAGDVASETLELQRLPSCGLDDFPQRAAELNEDQILIVKAIRGK
jgi:hypothetical protein